MLFSEIQPFVRYVHFLTVNEDAACPLTYPRDCRVFYNIAGEGDIEVGEDTYRMAPGSLIVIRAGTRYRFLLGEKPAVYLCVNFDFTQHFHHMPYPLPFMREDNYTPDQITETVVFEDLPDFLPVLCTHERQHLGGRMFSLEREYALRAAYFRERMGAILTDVLTDCARTVARHEVRSEPPLPERILGYIHENYRTSLTNGQIASIFGLHPNYVSSLIKSFTGLPLHKYLVFVRISGTIERLDADFSTPIRQIAADCGFSDIFYFSRYFRKFTGMTPSEYRRTHHRARLSTNRIV